MTGYLAFRNSEPTILSYNTMTSELNIDSEVFNDLTYGSTTTWDTANKLVTKRKLQISGSTTLNITNSTNGQRGFLVVIATNYGIITLPGYKKTGITTVLASGERCVYTYLYDGSDYYWQSGDVYNTTGTYALEKEGVIFEHLLNNAASNLMTTSPANGGSGAQVAITSGGALLSSTPGMLQLQTGITATGRAGCKGLNLVKLGSLYIDLEFSFRLRNLNDSTDQYNIQVGLGNTVSAAFGFGVFVYYDQVDTTFKYISRTSTASTTVNSGFSPVANTYYTGRIVVNGSTSVTYSINGSNTQVITTNIPGTSDALFTAFMITKSLGTSDRFLDLDWVKFYYKVIA